MKQGKLAEWLTLYKAPGISSAKFFSLVEAFGSPGAVLSAPRSVLEQQGLKPRSLDAIGQANTSLADNDLQWAKGPEHHIICFDDAAYPPRLRDIENPPPMLFVWGDPDFLSLHQLAIVGSRNPSASGRRCAEDFAKYLSQAGITVTSGLAHGIDGASHKGALQGIAGTVAVVAHGLDIIYPKVHFELAKKIAENGAVVSEWPLGTAPHRGLFPLRNRIISGLSLGVLVVEAARNSGSLITARYAISQNREVFAIPGSIHNPLTRGCHQLIRQGAKLVETGSDIIEELQLLENPAASGDTRAQTPQSEAETLDADYMHLLNCVDFEPASVDTLIERSGLPAANVASMLLILELQDLVVSNKGMYCRIDKRD